MLYKHFLDELEKRANYPQSYPPQQPYPQQPPKEGLAGKALKAAGFVTAVGGASRLAQHVGSEAKVTASALKGKLRQVGASVAAKASDAKNAAARWARERS